MIDEYHYQFEYCLVAIISLPPQELQFVLIASSRALNRLYLYYFLGSDDLINVRLLVSIDPNPFYKLALYCFCVLLLFVDKVGVGD